MELRTERLVLREFLPTDVPTVFAYQSDSAYRRYGEKKAPTEEDVRDFVQMLIGWAAAAPRTKYQLAVTLDGHLIGTVGVRTEVPDSTDAEFGCELDPRYWGQGYAREASRAILAFGFGTLGVRRIWARTVPENMRAVRLAEDLGLRRIADGVYERQRNEGAGKAPVDRGGSGSTPSAPGR